MSERSFADFPPGTRVVRTAAPTCKPDVPAGERGNVLRTTYDGRSVMVRFDGGEVLSWGAWPGDEWPLACIAPICTRRVPVGPATFAECGRELPCAVHDAPAVAVHDAPEACGCETCLAPPRRLYMRERKAPAEVEIHRLNLDTGELRPVSTIACPDATPAAKPCRWCRGPCRRPITHGED